MKEKEKKQLDIKNSTFHNFNITSKKSEIASKVDKMKVNEYNNIKLITTFFMPNHLKNNKVKNSPEKLNLNKKNILNFPLSPNNKNLLKKISFKKGNNIKSYSSFSDIQNKMLMSMLNKNNLIKKKNISLKNNTKIIATQSPFKLINMKMNNNISEGNKEIIIDIQDEEEKKPVMHISKNNKINIFKKDLKSQINYNQKKLNNINILNSTNNIKNKKPKNLKSLGNASILNKYYITANNFNYTQGNQPQNYKKNKINTFLSQNQTKYNTNFINNNRNILQAKSFNYKNKNINFLGNTNYKNKNTKISSNSFDSKNAKNDKNAKNKSFNKIKLMQRSILNYWKLLELENNFNKKYNDNISEMTEKNRLIKRIKEKCKIVLEEIDKKNNFEIQHIMKEINSQLLGLGFNEFYRYLLTILKNYDKKIVDWSFDIVEDKNECPEELKFKNVRNRHKQFMGILNRQYVDGVNANNHMDYLIKNSKSKMGFNNNEYYDNINLNTNNNNDDTQNHFIDNIFTENNYKSKFYEKFLKNK